MGILQKESYSTKALAVALKSSTIEIRAWEEVAKSLLQEGTAGQILIRFLRLDEVAYTCSFLL